MAQGSYVENEFTRDTAYIEDLAGQLLAATEDFRDVYLAGDTERAQDLYVLARRHFERIEPTAEAFGIEEPGDLDAALDLRIQDLSAGADTPVTDPELLAGWTGWHRIEADLFSDDEAFDFPDELFAKRVWHVARPVPEPDALQRAVTAIGSARRPLVVAGGGVAYSQANEALRVFAEATGKNWKGWPEEVKAGAVPPLAYGTPDTWQVLQKLQPAR